MQKSLVYSLNMTISLASVVCLQVDVYGSY